MKIIKFIATYLMWDINGYAIRYSPPREEIHRTSGENFSNLLLEAVCGLPEANPNKEPVVVSLEGRFPKKYLDETKRVFDFYSRAENVNVNIIQLTTS